MTRAGHHRAVFRTGPHHTWLQKKTYHIAKASTGPILALGAIIGELVRVGVPSGFNPVVLLRARKAYDEALPYATDETGEVWK